MRATLLLAMFMPLAAAQSMRMRDLSAEELDAVLDEFGNERAAAEHGRMLSMRMRDLGEHGRMLSMRMRDLGDFDSMLDEFGEEFEKVHTPRRTLRKRA